MSLVVQKFGGTSVADAAKIHAAAQRAIDAYRLGHRVLVVVSARGKTTDELIDLALQISPRPPAREMDLLLSTGEQVSVALMAMAIQAEGVPAVGFTGAQVGIVTDSFHTKARIRDISTDRITSALDEGRIVIVAGFQGIDANFNITTLGRGGSDTTAVALAAVLGADVCEIYTDVEGVYTTDPRFVPDALRIDRISYDEMLELASLGAGVMHSRSIEFAKKYGVPIHVRSSASQASGTWIIDGSWAHRAGEVVVGAALARDEARITVTGVPDQPGIVHELFQPIAEAQVVVDMIVQDMADDGTTEVSFTVAGGDLPETLQAAWRGAEQIGATGVESETNLAKVSIVGQGMATATGVATTMFQALAEAEINIRMITTSEIKLSVLVEGNLARQALQVVHRAFGLDHHRQDRPAPDSMALRQHLTREGRVNPVRPNSDDLVATDWNHSTQMGMEDLVISGIELDPSQSLVTIRDVPDRPGVAAEVFDHIGRQEILVDMIVQNVSSSGTTHLSFSVPRDEAEDALATARGIGLGGRVELVADLAKLAVLGIGMRSHTGVATRMFATLASHQINIAMINTSEVRINIATELGQGQDAHDALQRAFAHQRPPDERSTTIIASPG